MEKSTEIYEASAWWLTPHRSAEEGILPAYQAELEAVAGAQSGLVDPVVLGEGGCSGPWKWEASENWEEGHLSGKGMAVREGAAVGVAWDLGIGLSLGEDQEEEKTQVERREGALWVGRSPGQGEAGRTGRQAG